MYIGVCNMGLIPFDRSRDLSNMRKDLDRIFTGFPFDFGDEQHHFGSIRIDIQETNREVIATCHIPGLDNKADVKVDIENNVLHISGSSNRLTEVKKENMFVQQRYASSFRRAIPLPATVSKIGVGTSCNGDVLEVKIPKIVE